MKTPLSQPNGTFDSEETLLGSESISLDESTTISRTGEEKKGISKKTQASILPAAALITGGIFIAVDAMPKPVDDHEVHDVLDFPGNVAPVATCVDNSMRFVDAFNAAREEVGPGGLFSWHGNIYTTYSKEEWDAMSPEQHARYDEVISNTNVPVEPYEEPAQTQEEVATEEVVTEGSTTEESTSESTEENADTETTDGPAQEGNDETLQAEVTPAPGKEENSDVEPGDEAPAGQGTEPSQEEVTPVYDNGHIAIENMQIHSIETGLGEEGETTVVNAFLDGHAAQLIDDNGDGRIDAILLDKNDDGIITEDEVIVPTSDIIIDDGSNHGEEEGAIVDEVSDTDLPDYVNDDDSALDMLG